MAASYQGTSSKLAKHEAMRDELSKRIVAIETEISRLQATLNATTTNDPKKQKLEAQISHQRGILIDAKRRLEEEEELVAQCLKAEARLKTLSACYAELLIYFGMKPEEVNKLDPSRCKLLAREKAEACLLRATGGAVNPKGNRDAMVLECIGHIRANAFLARYYRPESTIKMHLVYKKELIGSIRKAEEEKAIGPEFLEQHLNDTHFRDQELKASKKNLRKIPNSKKTHALGNKTHWVRY